MDILNYCILSSLSTCFLLCLFCSQGVSPSMNSSEFVRQELRAVVSGRTQQRPSQSPIGGPNTIMGTANNTNNNNTNNNNNNSPSISMGVQQQMSNAMMNSSADMGFNFDMPTPGN